MKKIGVSMILLSVLLSKNIHGQDVPTDVRGVFKKIATYEEDLDKILNSGDDESQIKKDVIYFEKKMTTLDRYVTNLKKRYLKKDYSLADLESAHSEFVSKYGRIRARYDVVASAEPSTIIDFKEQMVKQKECIAETTSGNFEPSQIDRHLKSCEKGLLILDKRISFLQDDFAKRSVAYDMTDVKASLSNLHKEFEQVKNGINSGSIDISAKVSAKLELSQITNYLMIYREPWAIYNETQNNTGKARKLRDCVNHLVEPYDWKTTPTMIKSEMATNPKAKEANKWLEETKKNIRSEPHFNQFLTNVLNFAKETNHNNGYPKEQYTTKANAMAENVIKLADFALNICGNLPKTASIRDQAKDFISKSSNGATAKKEEKIALPKAKMNDAQLEQQTLDHFNSLGWDEQFLKVLLLNDEYDYVRSYGVISARTLPVGIISKDSKGLCSFQWFTIIQDKTPDGYNKPKKYSVGGKSRCECL